MRYVIGVFFLVFSAVTLTTFAQQARQQATPVVSVRLTTETPTVRLGAPIKVRATLTNESNRQLSFNVSVQGNHRFDVTGDRGAVARRPRTAPSDSRFGGASLLGPEVMVSPSIATLNAGASREEEITVSNLFSFDHLGTYQIRAIHSDPVSNEPVTSNPVTITVVQ